LVASVNFMRLSLKKAAYVGVYESSVVGNPECARDDKWRVVTFSKGRQIGWTEKKQQVPPLRYPGFPVEVSGVGELHAAFSTESRIRGRW
jgi:hypothetical protein